MVPSKRWPHLSDDQSHDKKPLQQRIEERIAHNKKLIAEGTESLLRTEGRADVDVARLTFLRRLMIETNVLESIADNTIE